MIIDQPVVSGSFSVTGSSTFVGNIVVTGSVRATEGISISGSSNLTGSLTVTNQIIAQTLNVQQVTSSIVYSSGSNIFGNDLSNTQQFTGSVTVTGSLKVNDSDVILTNQTSSITVLSSSYAATSSYPISVLNYNLYSTDPPAGIPGPSAYDSIFLGYNAGLATTASEAIFIGPNAGNGARQGNNSNFIGGNAGYNATFADYANFLGYRAGYTSDWAQFSNFLGYRAGDSANWGQYSNFLGYQAGTSATSASNSNFFGQSAGYEAVSASYSTLIGYQAGWNNLGTIGSNNIVIGTNITLGVGIRNAINLGAIIFATGSYSNPGGFPFSGSVGNGRVGINKTNPIYNLDVSGSGNFTNGLTVTGSVIATSFTGSLLGSSSYALTASYISGSGAGVGFPFSGSAVITGSLLISNLSGSGIRYVVADENGLMTAQTASTVLKTTQTYTASAGQTTFSVTNGYSTGYVDVFINGSKLNDSEFTDTSGTDVLLLTASFDNDIVEVVKYLPAQGVSNNVLRTLTTFTAAASQSTFNVGYTPGLIDIFYNGSRLSPIEYTANNGTSFTLATASAAGDTLDVLVYSYQVGAYAGIGGSGQQNQVAYYTTTSSISGSDNFTFDGSTLRVTGSIITSGSSTFVNIGPTVLSGSLTVSGSITAVGGITISGSIDSASYASNAEKLDNFDSTAFVFTSSFNTYSSSMSTRVGRIEGNYATTGSNVFIGTQIITGSLLVTSSLSVNGCIVSTGQIVAQTINVQQVTSSVVYSCGNNIFGCSLANTQQFTGSMLVTGSTDFTGVSLFRRGTLAFTLNPSYIQGNVYSQLQSTGDLALAAGGDSNKLYISSSGQVGVNTLPNSSYTVSIKRAAGGSGTLYLIGNDNVVGLPRVNFYNDNNTSGSYIGMNAINGLDLNGVVNITGSNVGIGTCTPGATLHVTGSSFDTAYLLSSNQFSQVWIGSCLTSNKAVGIGYDSTNQYGYINVYGTSAGSSLTFKGSNVGIGITNPKSTLDVATTTSGTDVSSVLTLSALTNAAYGQCNIIQGFINDSGNSECAIISSIQFIKQRPAGNCLGGDMVFSTRTPAATSMSNPTERMRITSGGNVGIGACTPGSKLEVWQSTNNRLLIDCVNLVNEPRISSLDSANNPQYLTINSYDLKINTNGTKRVFIDSTGISCFACQVCAPTFVSPNPFLGIYCVNPTICTGYVQYDMVSTSNAGLWQVYVATNPNPGGSSTYTDYYYGKIIIGNGYDGANLKTYLTYCPESILPRSLYGSGGGNVAVCVCLVQGGNEYTCVNTGSGYCIRVKIGGNGNYTAVNLVKLLS